MCRVIISRDSFVIRFLVKSNSILITIERYPSRWSMTWRRRDLLLIMETNRIIMIITIGGVGRIIMIRN